MAALTFTIEAGLAVLEGRTDEGVELYAAAFDAWRALDCSLDLALAELDSVMLLGAEHPASVVGKEAEDIFTQLGAVPYLERLAAARAAPAG